MSFPSFLSFCVCCNQSAVNTREHASTAETIKGWGQSASMIAHATQQGNLMTGLRKPESHENCMNYSWWIQFKKHSRRFDVFLLCCTAIVGPSVHGRRVLLMQFFPGDSMYLRALTNWTVPDMATLCVDDLPAVAKSPSGTEWAMNYCHCYQALYKSCLKWLEIKKKFFCLSHR